MSPLMRFCTLFVLISQERIKQLKEKGKTSSCSIFVFIDASQATYASLRLASARNISAAAIRLFGSAEEHTMMARRFSFSAAPISIGAAASSARRRRAPAIPAPGSRSRAAAASMRRAIWPGSVFDVRDDLAARRRCGRRDGGGGGAPQPASTTGPSSFSTARRRAIRRSSSATAIW